MSDEMQCPYTLLGCDGGTIREDGTIGCGYKEAPDSACVWTEDGRASGGRDFYNSTVMEMLSCR